MKVPEKDIKKMDSNKLRFALSNLTNDETSSDAELKSHLIKEGEIPESVANWLMRSRDVLLGDVREAIKRENHIKQFFQDYGVNLPMAPKVMTEKRK